MDKVSWFNDAQKAEMRANFLLGLSAGGVGLAAGGAYAGVAGAPLRIALQVGFNAAFVGGCYGGTYTLFKFAGLTGYPAHISTGAVIGFLAGGLKGGNVTHSTRSAIAVALAGCTGRAACQLFEKGKDWWLTPSKKWESFWIPDFYNSRKKRDQL